MEKRNNSVYFTFGRFNPPHRGHGELIKYVIDLAGSHSDYYIIVSSTQNKTWINSKVFNAQKEAGDYESLKTNENPLNVSQKMKYLHKMYPGVKFIEAYGNNIVKTVENMKELGYTDITGVFGEDREESFKKAFKGSINILGLPRSSPISATKLRKAAVKNEIDYFTEQTKSGNMSEADSLELMKEVRKELWNEFGKTKNYLNKNYLNKNYLNKNYLNKNYLIRCNRDIKYLKSI